MSAIPPKADIGWERWHVHFVPKAGIVPLFHFYTVDGFSFWNSYAPHLQITVASARSSRALKSAVLS